uniref:Cytochrome b n=1 Tax=Aglaiogyrodactylus forficulatus TaxID=1853073 RepID=A0A173G4R0_9PLAT|nr:cytochrome b [Aglaiogyrodactylus forficulatus]ANH20402.1 cytochrome b [Aglaiogyrodactylus forficulatus]
MLKIVKGNVYDLPTNVGINYFWCGGFTLSFILIIQVLTGVILSLLYVADQFLSFNCVMGLSNDELLTWFIRYFHIWGASAIFLVLFIHVLRGFYYNSYNKTSVWSIGFVLYLLMMVEAFLGYILPWHQMSYWAATVLTSVIQSVPFVGPILYTFIVGGFGVTNVTLTRMFAAHVILAFVILGLSGLHLVYLHKSGSSNSLNLNKGYSDSIYFHHYFSAKDVLSILGFLLCLFLIVLYNADLVLDSEAYLQANYMVTPVNIKPEWYFLFYYAMLRSISSKVGGLVFILLFLFVLWVPSGNNVLCTPYSNFHQIIFWLIIGFLIILSYFGACHPEWPYDVLSLIISIGLVILIICYKFVPVNKFIHLS